jgi:hypothetical protein
MLGHHYSARRAAVGMEFSILFSQSCIDYFFCLFS